MRTSSCVTVLVLMIVSSAWAQQAPKLERFASRHYQVYTDMPMTEARLYANHMDRMFDEYNSRISAAGFRQRGQSHFNFYLLKDRQSYIEFMASIGINGSTSEGMFFIGQHASGLATFGGEQDEDRVKGVIQHEGFHQFAHARIGNIPIWVNEGMAEYFEHGMFIGHRFVMGQVPEDRLDTLKKLIEDDNYLPFEYLINMGSQQWGANMSSGTMSWLQYAQSWSLVHFLVHAERGRYETAFMNYLRAINGGMQSGEAFAAAFGNNSHAAFEAKWKQYMLQLEPDPIYMAQVRLQFLAAGLKKLYSQGKTITSLEQLKEELQKIKFKRTVKSHAGKRVYKAEDDSLYAAPQVSKISNKARIIMVKNPNEADPPIIRIVGIGAVARIEWTRDDEDELRWSVVLE